MSSSPIMKTANVARMMTIGKFEGINEELFDIQPLQFNNTIRWNLGHIIAVMDSLVFQRITQTSKLPSGFGDLFKSGTKPSDWTSAPPSKEQLMQALKQQLNDFHETFAGREDETLASPFQIRDFKFETVGDAIGFAVIHEAQHLAVASSLVKVINYNT
jgi:hypothetical protein